MSLNYCGIIRPIVLLLALCAVTSAADIKDERLRRAGIEPTPRAVQQYLERIASPARDDEPKKLIASMGAETFRERQDAMERLTDLGFVAIKEIEEATKDADPEIAWRAKAILVTVRSGAKRSTLVGVLKAVEEHKIPVGLALLLRVRAVTTSADVQAACDAAMAATIVEADREAATKLVKAEELELRNVGRRLLARLDPAAPPPLLEGTFDALDVTVGQVAGGGHNLIDGWEFRPKTDLRVTHLGILDHSYDGLWDEHPVAIWDLENDKEAVAELTIPAGQEAPLSGVFRVMPLKAPVKLKAGKRYAVVALYPETKTMDSAVGMTNPGGLTVKFSSHLEIAGRRYAFPHKKMAFPSDSGPGQDHATIGPTLRYEVVPE